MVVTTKSLRDDLFGLFACPAEVFLEMRGRTKAITPHQWTELEKYIDQHQRMLMVAQHFVVDEDAEALLAALIEEMSAEGLEDTFAKVNFPFKYVLLESTRDLQAQAACLLVEGDEGFYSECFVGLPGGIAPNLKVLAWEGTSAEVFDSAVNFENFNAPEQVDQELKLNGQFCGMFVAMTTLLGHKGMLEAEETPFYPRADRRRAQKSGKPLPDTRKITIRLGEAGRGQMEAMKDGAQSSSLRTVRAHWVRGHFMRNRSGGLSWRMPHIRGAGPLISQNRIITSEKRKD